MYLLNIRVLHFDLYICGQFNDFFAKIWYIYIMLNEFWHGNALNSCCRPVNLILNTLYFDVLFCRQFPEWRHFVNWTQNLRRWHLYLLWLPKHCFYAPITHFWNEYFKIKCHQSIIHNSYINIHYNRFCLRFSLKEITVRNCNSTFILQ